jgi:superoxide dismutase, Fe-Mn family
MHSEHNFSISCSRRQLLQSAGAALALSVFGEKLAVPALAQGQPQPPAGPFTLPALPYANDALDGAIDARTMEIHHDRHHAAYVAGLNTALANQAELSRRPIDRILREINQVPAALRQAVTNHGGGHYNHSMFWTIMGPNAGGNPAGALADAINSTFTNFDTFKTQFRTASLARFGSGWSWLVWADRRLQITHTANQDCPLMSGQFPILGLDVWEHAYYLRYQNRRADYVDAWWRVVNWNAVATRFDQARQS